MIAVTGMLEWPVAQLPLYNVIYLVFPLRTLSAEEARHFAGMEQVATLTAMLRRADPGIEMVDATVVDSAEIPALAPRRSSFPHALTVRVSYPDGLTPDELRRRRFVLIRAILAR